MQFGTVLLKGEAVEENGLYPNLAPKNLASRSVSAFNT